MRLAYAIITALCLVLAATNANAAERHVYDGRLFATARAEGKSILVHVTAAWCGVCRAQKPVVADLARRADFAELVIFDLDFDTQKVALGELRVLKQSTLIVFKGMEETGRAVGITKFETIEALIRKAL